MIASAGDCADIETLDASVFNSKDMLHDLVGQQLAVATAHDLADLGRDLALGSGREAHRLDVRIDALPLARPVLPHTFVPGNVPALPAVRPQDVVVQGRQDRLDVPRVEPLIEALQKLHLARHRCPQSSLMLALSATAFQRAASRLISSPNSGEVVERASTEIASSAVSTAGMPSVSATASCRRSTISLGVPAGATRPVNSTISISPNPCSTIVGTSGKLSGRFAVVMPIAFSLPALIGPLTGPESMNAIST